MKKYCIALCLAVIVMGFASSPAHADLDVFLRNLNVEARMDIGKYNVGLSAQFGVPVPQVDVIMQGVAEPADAFMVLQLGQMTGKPPEAVLGAYQKDKGWGAIAKDLGIKPGSSEFHALKRGDFSYTGQPGGGGKSRGKGKKHGK
jgi:hypothetical protein